VRPYTKSLITPRSRTNRRVTIRAPSKRSAGGDPPSPGATLEPKALGPRRRRPRLLDRTVTVSLEGPPRIETDVECRDDQGQRHADQRGDVLVAAGWDDVTEPLGEGHALDAEQELRDDEDDHDESGEGQRRRVLERDAPDADEAPEAGREGADGRALGADRDGEERQETEEELGEH